MSTAQPLSGLIKRLVGDFLEISLPDEGYEQVRLLSNANFTSLVQPLTKKEDVWTTRVQLTKSGTFWWRLETVLEAEGAWKNALYQDRLVSGRVQVDPAWLSQAIVYNVFVRFFKGKVLDQGVIQPGEGGTFDDVKAHLDTLRAMGINVLYLNPIHLIGEVKRKYNLHDLLPSYMQPGSPYSIKDYKSIDPELTYDRDTKKHLLSDPQQEFRDLVDAAHQRGMFVIMDLVFNHTAHDFVFQRIRPEWYLYKLNPTNLNEPYLMPEDVDRGLPWGDSHHTVPPFDHGIWWEDAAQLNWEYKMVESPNKPPKNPTLDEMREYFISIPQYWIKHFGVDGFRCDIAYRVPPDFWAECIASSRQLAQELKTNLSHDVVYIAESYTNDLRLLQEVGFACVYGDYSHKLARPLDLKGYLDYLYNISDTHFPDGSRWFTFPESHDFGRTPQKILGNQANEQDKALLANQSRWLLTATLPGTPLIFNGFEKIEWQPVNLFSYGAVDWQRNNDLFDFISKVNRIRHHYPALKKGDYRYLETNQGLNEKTQLFAFMRTYKAQQLIVIVNMDVNKTAGPALVYLPEGFEGTYQLVDLLTGTSYRRKGRELTIVLEPGQGHLFLVKR